MTVAWRPPCRACSGAWSWSHQDWRHRTGCPREGDRFADLGFPSPGVRQLDLPPKDTETVGCTCHAERPGLCPYCADAADGDDYTGEP